MPSSVVVESSKIHSFSSIDCSANFRSSYSQLRLVADGLNLIWFWENRRRVYSAIWMEGVWYQFLLWSLSPFCGVFLSKPIWRELRWEEHFILTCPMHSPACLPFVKWTNCTAGAERRIIGQNMERQLIECFQQLLLAHSSLILFRNNLLHIISHLVVLRRRGGFQFSIRQQIISYSCNYFAGTRVKCTRLKKSDLFSIFWPKPLEAPFPSDLLRFFHFGMGSPPGEKTCKKGDIVPFWRPPSPI